MVQSLKADLLQKGKIFKTFTLSNIWKTLKGENHHISQFHAQVFYFYDYYIVSDKNPHFFCVLLYSPSSAEVNEQWTITFISYSLQEL